MTPAFRTVTIIGAGLLGGSLGLALKQRGLARKVRGVGRRRASLEVALSRQAIDEAFLDASEASRGADLVVLCTPAALVIPKLDEIQDACGDAVVTDVASTKTAICRHAARTWPHPLRFVGSHPMAGSEQSGAEHARADLYQGSRTAVADVPGTDEGAREAVRGLWEAVGARVVEMTPERHDDLVARTSHVPHIAAACLAEVAGAEPGARPLVGRGFRDTTRIAAGRPEIWRDICLTNRDSVLAALGDLAGHVARVRSLVEDEDAEGLDRFFASAQQARRRALEQ